MFAIVAGAAAGGNAGEAGSAGDFGIKNPNVSSVELIIVPSLYQKTKTNQGVVSVYGWLILSVAAPNQN